MVTPEKWLQINNEWTAFDVKVIVDDVQRWITSL
jgi:hypothetical protein